MSSRFSGIAVLLWLAVASLSGSLIAAEKPSPPPAGDTSSPRGTLALFIESMEELYDTVQSKEPVTRIEVEDTPIAIMALACLDTSELPEYARDDYAAEAAVCIKEVLDRVSLLSLADAPGPDEIQAKNGGTALASWRIPRTRISLVRIEEGPRRGEYLFSPETVKRAPQIYRRMKTQPYREEGPAVTRGFHDFWLSAPGNRGIAYLLDWLPRWVQESRTGIGNMAMDRADLDPALFPCRHVSRPTGSVGCEANISGQRTCCVMSAP